MSILNKIAIKYLHYPYKESLDKQFKYCLDKNLKFPKLNDFLEQAIQDGENNFPQRAWYLHKYSRQNRSINGS